MSLSRMAVDAFSHWEMHPRHRLGVGGVYQVKPTLKLDLGSVTEKVEFNSSLGYAAEYGFRFTSTGAVLAVRYTQMDYALEGSQEDIGASHLGLIVYAYF